MLQKPHLRPYIFCLMTLNTGYILCSVFVDIHAVLPLHSEVTMGDLSLAGPPIRNTVYMNTAELPQWQTWGHQDVDYATALELGSNRTIAMQGLWLLMLHCRADSRLAPSPWETSLQSNAVSHWLGANLESALHCEQIVNKYLENYWNQNIGSKTMSYQNDTKFAVGTVLRSNLISYWTIPHSV